MSSKSNANLGVASAGYSITAKIKIINKSGNLRKVFECIADLGGSLAEVDLEFSDYIYNIRNITINSKSSSHAEEILANIKSIDCIEVLDWKDDTFTMHEGGKLSIESKYYLKNANELARAYTPGVARVCTAIHEDPIKVHDYTIKSKCVAVVTDGSAVLGLGNIGPHAALPVMEGKAVLFKRFAGLDSFPIALDTQDTEEIIAAVKSIAPTFAGINLEDISAPRCFEIEKRLKEELDIPVFHDDQHGTAVVVTAGVYNALKLVNKKPEDIKAVVSGFGAGGVACTKMLLGAGIKNIIPCDSRGIVYRGRAEGMNPVKDELIQLTNPDNVKVSQPGTLTREMVQTMAKDPIIFALANPIPEIMPEEIADIASIIATGRSDYANQVNNVLCFPGIFKGAIDCRASDITENMKLAAAKAIAESIPENELSPDRIIPPIFGDIDISEKVAERVKEAAIKDGVARI
ncbi:UNVERIFIED_CONTAM: hypothetical protein GTU68_001789 [Idotea baltica]|nr:hypothetical protein [Idotea baltica]